jgi:ligand-binding sensor domain-containing protein
LFAVALCHGLTAQEPAYLHYNVSDGLPSSLVYSIDQDREGFMWFCTDKGLARFDGTRFKVYSIKQGLPDSDVLGVHEDKYDRLWLSCFQNNPCFIKDGAVFTSQNDSLLREMDLKGGVFVFTETEDGNLWITGDANKYCKISNGKALECHPSPYWSFNDHLPLEQRNRIVTVEKVIVLKGKTFVLGQQVILEMVERDSFQKVFTFKNIGISDEINSIDYHGDYVMVAMREKLLLLKYSNNHFEQIATLNGMQSSLVKVDRFGRFWVSSQKDGAVLFEDIATEKFDKKQYYLKGKKVTATFTDKDGNLWFGTLNEGAYMLPKKASVNFTKEAGLPFKSNNILSLARSATGRILAGDDSGNMYVFNGKTWQRVDFNTKDGYNRVLQILALPANGWVAVTEEGVFSSEHGLLDNIKFQGAPKSAYYENGKFWLGTSSFLLKMDGLTAQPERVLINRTTNICADTEGNVWVGGLNGIFSQQDGFKRNWGEVFKPLSKRILDIEQAGKGALWVASSEFGLLRVLTNDGDVTKVTILNDSLAAPIENIQRIFPVGKDQAWLATNTGVYWLNNNGTIKHFNESNGLASNNVNAVLAIDDTLWIATTSGLSRMALGNEVDSLHFATRIASIRYQKGAQSTLIDYYEIQQRNNQVVVPTGASMLEVDLGALHFGTRGNLTYAFETKPLFLPIYCITWDNLLSVLAGLFFDRKKELKIAGETKGYGITAMPGKFHNSVTAILPNGTKSTQPAILTLTVLPYWWQVIWVHLFLAGLAVMGTRRLFKARERLLKLQNANSELQLQAIRAQMNPHFVGNSINAIQQFFYPPDPIKASEYISIFSDLLRRTMHFSETDFITFAEELAYINDYLKMINLRFGNRFSYEIIGVETISEDTVFPSMLLQPILENATIHGLAPSGPSMLSIRFNKKDGRINCTVTDNGVGIEVSRERKAKADGTKRISKGIQLLERKVETLNQLYQKDIKIEILDMRKLGGDLHGTQATISYTL